MKLHFDGTTEYLGTGTVGWAQFSCQFTYKEVTLLEAYLCSKLIPYHLTACFHGAVPYDWYMGSRPWYLNMPEKDAMEFRLRFPCPHVSTEDLRKGIGMIFFEFSLDFVLDPQYFPGSEPDSC